jgi:cyclophilin family peptidyl-prolyl cis-trans isomerase/nucleoside 2-deoxyribosyltransferase
MRHVWIIAVLLSMVMAINPDLILATKNPKVLLETNMGDITLELYPEKAPVAVENFLKYVRNGHYENSIFHRVINNYMIQGGGYSSDMKKIGSTFAPIKNEAANGLKNDRGTIAIARTKVINSGRDQFFINVVDNDFLNHRDNTKKGYGYAVFGRVTAGMDIVDKISKVDTSSHGQYKNAPVSPVTIESASELSPVQQAQKVKNRTLKKEKDTSPPEIIITSHQTKGVKGAKIEERSKLTTITGIVKDNSEIVNLTVNDTKVKVDEDGVFRADADLKVGKNNVAVSATDIFGNTARKALTIIREEPAKTSKPSELNSEIAINDKYLNITTAGWKLLEKLRKKQSESNKAFVAMWFPDKEKKKAWRDKLEKAWVEGFKPALESTGFQPIRADVKKRNDKVCNRIIADIRKSGLLIADVTGNRQEVYYEAGFAAGMDIKVIWTCNEEFFIEEELHIDARQYNYILWENPKDLKNKLINRLQASPPY